MATLRLSAGHVQPLWAGHPWVYAQAVDRVEGGAVAGEEVSVLDPHGNLLGRGFYSPSSAIVARILVRDATTKVDRAFFRDRIDRAIRLRAELGLPAEGTTGYRLVHADGDGLPGLVVDRFNDVLSIQLLTIGMKQREAEIVGALEDALRPRSIIDRTPLSVGKLEHFTPGSGLLRGENVTSLRFQERGFEFDLAMDVGQKTGFYFDQRGLRGRVESLSAGRRVLDTYTFVGAFAMAAARGGAASVTAIDDSASAVLAGASCAQANGLADRIAFVKQDARKALQTAGAEGGYDLVIVDPPRLAPTRGARDQALSAYSKLAELGCRATRPDGLMVFCSCSAAVDLTSLTRALAAGARRANVQAVVLERHFQGPDHPVLASFPEGLYLKALIARVEPR